MKLRAWPAVRRVIAVVVVLLTMSLSTVGWSKQSASTVSEAGSTTGDLITKRLADEYMQKHSDVRVITGGGGTAVGVTSPRV